MRRLLSPARAAGAALALALSLAGGALLSGCPTDAGTSGLICIYTFDPVNGDAPWQVEVDVSLPYFSRLPKAESVVNPGLRLAYWQDEATGIQFRPGKRVNTSTDLFARDCTFHALWAGLTYTLTFDKQGGSGGTDSVQTTYAQPLPAIAPPERAGYGFRGYWTETGGQGTQYYTAAGTSARNWDQPSDAVLYAQWKMGEYTITLDAQGGTVTASGWNSAGGGVYTRTYTTEDADITLPAVVKTGWSAVWKDADGNTVTEVAHGSIGDKRFTAQWTANTYTITYDGNGNTGGSAPESQTKTYGTPLTLQDNSSGLVKTNYIFAGWNTSADGTGTSYPAGGNLTEDLADAQDAVVTLYARWSQAEIVITWNPAGGIPAGRADSEPWTETKNPGDTITPLSVTPPSGSGVYFDCWVDTSDENKEYPAGTPFTIPSDAESGSMAMLAQYIDSTGGVVIPPAVPDESITLTWGGDVDTTGAVPTVPQWGNLRATVNNAGSYTAFEWYVVGTVTTPLGTSNPLNVEVATGTGTRYLTVVVTKNKTRYSKVFTFTVTAPPAPENHAPNARLWW